MNPEKVSVDLELMRKFRPIVSDLFERKYDLKRNKETENMKNHGVNLQSKENSLKICSLFYNKLGELLTTGLLLRLQLGSTVCCEGLPAVFASVHIPAQLPATNSVLNCFILFC